MAYDEELANRVRTLMGPAITERRMFGGLAMLVNGNMAVAVRGGGGLMVRVDPDQSEALCRERGAALVVMRGREMPGWVAVEPDACARQADLKRWVTRGQAYAATLPPK